GVYLGAMHRAPGRSSAMQIRRVVPPLVVAAASLASLAGVRDARALTPGQRCEKTAAKAVSSCFRTVGKAEWKCYRDAGAGGLPGAEDVTRALAKLESQVLDACPDAARGSAAGYPPVLTPPALAGR